MRLKLFGLESDTPALDKVADLMSKGDLFDALHQEITEENEAPEETSEDSTPDTPTDDNQTDEEPVGVDNDEVTSEADATAPSMEAILLYHELAQTGLKETRVSLAQETLLDTSKYVGGKVLDGLRYIKDIGFEYGPVILKHVFKGVMVALNRSLKGIVRGAIAIQTTIKDKLNSYSSYQSKIAKAREILDSLESTTLPEGLRFENSTAISQLKINTNVNVLENVKLVEKFNRDFFSGFEKNVSQEVASIAYLIKSVISGVSDIPHQKLAEKPNFTGFTKGDVVGYTPVSTNCVTYAYSSTLPGDVKFIGHIPAGMTNDSAELMESYSASKMFFGFTPDAKKAIESCDFISIEALRELLDVLDKICDVGITTEAEYSKVIDERNHLKNDFRLYLKHLLTIKDKVSIRDSLAEYIQLKVEYMDKTYINGSFKIHDYNVSILSSALTYIGDCLDKIKSTTKK